MNPQHNMPRLINWLGYFAIGLLLILPLSVLTIRPMAAGITPVCDRLLWQCAAAHPGHRPTTAEAFHALAQRHPPARNFCSTRGGTAASTDQRGESPHDS